ncbi:MFS-type transporter SLC18B1-like [Ixodes scapularis]
MISFIDLIWVTANLIGSSLGGILIDWWAYPLPFYVFSATLVLAFLFLVKFRFQEDLPNETSNVTNTEESPSTSCWKLLLDRLFLPDLFGLSRTEIGKLYAVQYASSMIGSVVAGISCYFKVETFFCFVGQIFAALAYLLVGPAPFIPYERALWMVYLAQAFIGLAMSLIMTCAYCHALKVVTLRGCPDTIQTKGFVSSSVMVAMMIGGLVSPPLAGYIVEQVGYRTGTMALFGLFAGWVSIVCTQDTTFFKKFINDFICITRSSQ